MKKSMKVVSESYLRSLFKKESPESVTLEKGQILTPSARQLLSERNIRIVMAGDAPEVARQKNRKEKAKARKRKPSTIPGRKDVPEGPT